MQQLTEEKQAQMSSDPRPLNDDVIKKNEYDVIVMYQVCDKLSVRMPGLIPASKIQTACLVSEIMV